MQHTVTVGKYRTTIDIPIQKLASRAKFVAFPRKQINESNNATVVNSCTHCINGEKQQQSSKITLSMIQQLQQSYDEDMKGYEAKVQKLEKHQIQLENQCNKKIEQTQKKCRKRIEQSQLYLEKRDHQLKFLKQQEQKNKKERDLFIKNINNSKIGEQQLYKKLLSFEEQIQILKNENINHQKRYLQAYEQKKILENKLQTNSRLLYQKKIESQQHHDHRLKLDDKIRQMQNQMTQKKQKIMNKQQQNVKYKIRLQETMNRIKQFEHNENKTKSQMYEIRGAFEKSSKNLQQKQNQVQILRQQLQQQSSKINNYDLKLIELEQNNGKSDLKLRQYQQNCAQIHSQRQNLSQQLRILRKQLLQYISQNKKLKEQLYLKEQPSHYEVKVERVIENKQYTNQLQRKLQNLIQELNNIKTEHGRLIEDYKRKNKQIDNNLNEISKLNRTIIELKEYIKKKQESFTWAIQRAIQKDIQLDNSLGKQSAIHHPSVYKVHAIDQFSLKNKSQMNQLTSQLGKQLFNGEEYEKELEESVERAIKESHQYRPQYNQQKYQQQGYQQLAYQQKQPNIPQQQLYQQHRKQQAYQQQSQQQLQYQHINQSPNLIITQPRQMSFESHSYSQLRLHQQSK